MHELFALYNEESIIEVISNNSIKLFCTHIGLREQTNHAYHTAQADRSLYSDRFDHDQSDQSTTFRTLVRVI
jgi:hypothetical protein